MATRDEKKLTRQRRSKGRKGGAPSLWERANPKPRKETQFDRDNLSLRCMNCDQIFNGPHTGETVKMNSAKYHRYQEENRIASGYQLGGISDGMCNKRSCIDAVSHADAEQARKRHPERDWTGYEESYRNSLYEFVRNEPDRFPGGLIEDAPPPAPPLGAADE